MSLEWFRDLIISILGIVAAGTLVFIAVILYLLYRRTRPIVDLINATVKTIHGLSSSVGEMTKPLAGALALIKGVREGIEIANKIFKKREGDKDA